MVARSKLPEECRRFYGNLVLSLSLNYSLSHKMLPLIAKKKTVWRNCFPNELGVTPGFRNFPDFAEGKERWEVLVQLGGGRVKKERRKKEKRI